MIRYNFQHIFFIHGGMEKSFYVIGNFKQNGRLTGIESLVASLGASSSREMLSQCRVVLLPPVPYLAVTSQMVRSVGVSVGAQMVSGYPDGSRTGCYHAEMVAEMGASYACVGHSERRVQFSEGGKELAAQYCQIVRSGLKPILCVGETSGQRQQGQTFSVLEAQLLEVFSCDGFDTLPMHDIILAYEPVWAVGAQHAADVESVGEVFVFLRDFLARYSQFSQRTLCYGGSVDASNCQQFYQSEHVSGLLVGRACLDVKELMGVITQCSGF